MPGPHEEGDERVPGPATRRTGSRSRLALSRPLLVVAGPTGTGKSDVAVLLAERLAGEIVGCDALQVYRGFDAATAKPGARARSRVPHHVVDHVDPRRDYTLAEYVRDADAAIAGIAGRGRLPIVVGGTGMYLRGLLLGIVEAPARDPVLRERLRRLATRHGAPRLHRWLARFDPGSAARVGTGDTQRIIRALEVALGSGTTWSERLRDEGSWTRREERYPARKFVLDLPRDLLAERLDRRVGEFFAAGLVAEVRSLLEEGVPATANAFKAIGYREVVAALASGSDPESVIEEVRRATRRYAKRQRTWFRGERDAAWIDASAGAVATADAIAARWDPCGR